MSRTVAIVGAGLGGLVLARILHEHGVEVTLYEGETSFQARTQGGLLDLHEDTGQAALRAAGLYGEFLSLVLPSEDAKRIVDRKNTVLFESGHHGGNRPEVSRGALRKMLLESIPEALVRWDHRVESVTSAEGRPTVVFANGSSVTSDVLVGADGAWSKVRPLLSVAVPLYSGIAFVETIIFDGDTHEPASANAIGRGTLMALAPGQGILAHRYANGTLHTYAALKKPEHWFQPLLCGGRALTLATVAGEFRDWAPPLLSLITKSATEPLLRPIYALPVSHRWERVKGITLLGDAAHLMSPFAGEGANLALLDGASLARNLLEHPDDPELALSAYEADLFPRSERMARRTEDNLNRFFSDTAPFSVVDLFKTLSP